MPFHVLPGFLVLPPFLCIVLLLAWLPMTPNSRWALRVWGLCLAVAIGVFVWSIATPANPLDFWEFPDWYPVISALGVIVVPFGSTFWLWRWQKRREHRLGSGAIFLIVLLIYSMSWQGQRLFDRSCIYFDSHHKTGKAWCPESWQAHL